MARKPNPSRARSKPRPPAPPPTPEVRDLSLRGVPVEVLADIDALLAERQAELAASGATLSRNALLLTLLRHGLRAARGGEATTPPTPTTPPEASEAPASAPAEAATTVTVAADAASPAEPVVDVVIPDPDPEPTIRPPPSIPHPRFDRVYYKTTGTGEAWEEWLQYERDNSRFRSEHPEWCERNGVARNECSGCSTRKRYPSYVGNWCTCGRVAALHRRTHPNETTKAAEATVVPTTEPREPEPPACTDPEKDPRASDQDRAAWLNYREALVKFRAEHQAWARRQRVPVTTRPPPRAPPKCFGCRTARNVSPLEPTPSCTCGRRMGRNVSP